MATQQKIASSSKIVPHLWFDHEAVDAARFYASVLPESRVGDVTPIPADTPSGPEGSVHVVEFTLFNQPFMAINAGPLFRFIRRFPSSSTSIRCSSDRRKRVSGRRGRRSMTYGRSCPTVAKR